MLFVVAILNRLSPIYHIRSNNGNLIFFHVRFFEINFRLYVCVCFMDYIYLYIYTHAYTFITKLFLHSLHIKVAFIVIRFVSY